jgi:uncharacterized membrane protein (UPF0127 family)
VFQKPKGPVGQREEIKIKGTKIYIELADTPLEKTKGLSGRNSLGKSEGMLFIFAQNTQPSFWMKDMNFGIDIIWIDDGKIIQIDKNVPNPSFGTPDSQLPRYTPKEPIDYVLEVNAGFSDKNNFEVGDPVDLSSL